MRFVPQRILRLLSVVFRAKYLETLQQAFEAQEIEFAGQTIPLGEPSAFGTFLATLRAKDWVAYAKPPSAVPKRCSATSGAYRIAISNERLLDGENGEIRFRYRDYAHGNKVKVMRLPAEELMFALPGAPSSGA